MAKKFHITNSVFHVQRANDDNISDDIIKLARKTGKLNLSNRHLVKWPEEILKLGVVHSDTDEIDMDNTKVDSFKWWELEPLKYLDMSSNNLKDIPKGVQELDSLMTLLLHQNALEVLPQELGLLYNLVKLDLAHNKICQFPPYLAKLKLLRDLNLSSNLFKVFPETIYDLVMLNKLDFSRNLIEEMKPGIGFLTRLNFLNLSQNKLSKIPPDLMNCKALKDLNLSVNEITSEGLPELTDMNVEIIQLHYNQLIHLPKLYGCSQLKEIHLGFNKIEEVTVEEFSTLSHLQIINLRNNHLKKLPKELSCFQNLIRLDVAYNDLTELPATLSLLPHLEALIVEGNSLRTIRRDILHGGTSRLLAYLKKLIANDEYEKNYQVQFPCTAVKEFPDSISGSLAMPTAEELAKRLEGTKIRGGVTAQKPFSIRNEDCRESFKSIIRNDSLNRFAMRCSRAVNLSCKELCNVPNTVFEEAVAVPCNMVDLSKNKLQRIPEGIWLLSRTLNDLNLSQNQLKDIPAEISTCLNLRYLNVANNKLNSLPEEFAQCVRLKELNVSFNGLEDVPLCVYSLYAIEILIMSDNKIANMDPEKFLNLKFLTHLDLSNNNLSSVPPLMGKMTQLRTFKLDGNKLRALRPATLAKGTEAVLAWLRDKIV